MRASQYIRSRQARELLRAVRHTYWMGRPVNWHVTINYGWPDAGDELVPSQSHRGIRRRFWSWWNYKRKKGQVTGDLYDAVIWEAPNGKHHAHWMIYIPPELLPEAIAVIENRAAKVLGVIDHDTVHQQDIGNVNGLLSYLLKGTEPEYANQIGIRPEYQGAIWCRRAVPSMALGRAARERDWQTNRTVQKDKTNGLPAPREKRVLMRQQAAKAS